MQTITDISQVTSIALYPVVAAVGIGQAAHIQVNNHFPALFRQLTVFGLTR